MKISFFRYIFQGAFFKNMRYTFSAIIFCFILSIAACTNNKDQNPLVSNEQYLVNNNWKLSTVETVPSIPGINPMDFLETCQLDNTFDFSDGGVLIVDEGATKCNENNPQVITGEWSLSQEQTQLQLVYGIITRDFTILEINDAVMKVQTEVIYQGFTVTANFNFLPVD